MFKKLFYMSIILLFLISAIVKAHGDEHHKEKMGKVSTMMHWEDEHEHSDSLEQVEEKESMEKDFKTIREDVEQSVVPTVIKAISLAAVIAGLAFLYLPRRKKESNNE